MTSLQAGVGAYNPHTDEVTYKAYYQWVPFVLFLQGIMFYVPHLIFKSWEGGKVQGIVAGLNQVGTSQCFILCYTNELGLKLRDECEFCLCNIY